MPKPLTMKQVANRVVVNASIVDPKQAFKPTAMAVAFVGAAIAYQCRGSNA